VTLLWLIIWTITERQAFMADCFLIEKQENTYSAYEKYSRYLSKKKRWRINQEDEFHSAVLPGLPA